MQSFKEYFLNEIMNVTYKDGVEYLGILIESKGKVKTFTFLTFLNREIISTNLRQDKINAEYFAKKLKENFENVTVINNKVILTITSNLRRDRYYEGINPWVKEMRKSISKKEKLFQTIVPADEANYLLDELAFACFEKLA